MRNRLLVVFAFLLVLVSCKKDENKIYLESSTAPVLTVSTTGPVVLHQADAAKPAISFNWTNPDYRFTTGISSQDVTYVLQIDSVGKNFRSNKLQEVSISKELGTTFTVKDFNAIFTKMDVPENVAHEFEFRVKANLVNGAAPLYSNVIKMMVTPYLDVAVPVPTNGDLWMTGDAAPSGWSNPLGSPYDVSQKFTRVSSSLYELTIALPGGGNYKLLQDNGDWSTQYHMLTGGTWEAGSFEKKDSDPGFPGPPSAGTYKITVNFKTGKYTVVKQ
ncbi:MAG TPA: SusE domain-containing protein [Flavisolibacter sp.]|nr:SusE domain-containing protein [Flavisolibacter sp.]